MPTRRAPASSAPASAARAASRRTQRAGWSAPSRGWRSAPRKSLASGGSSSSSHSTANPSSRSASYSRRSASPLRVVGSQPQAADAAERVARELLHAVERALGQRHRRRRRSAPSWSRRRVVRQARAAEREAAVAPARAAGDLARLVEPHADAALRERQRARAPVTPPPMTATSGRPRARRAAERPRAASSSQYELLSLRRSLTPAARSPPYALASPTRPASSSSTSAAATHAGVETGRTRQLVGRRGASRARRARTRSGGPRPAPAPGAADSSPSTSRTSPTHVTGAAPSRSRSFVPGESVDGDLAGNGQHLATLVEREVGGDQRAASLARLDDDRRGGEARDDPVARRETARAPARRPARTRRRSARRRDLARASSRCARRIVAVDAAAEHGDVGRRLERAAVRLAVDPAREPGDDDERRPRRGRAPSARATCAP